MKFRICAIAFCAFLGACANTMTRTADNASFEWSSPTKKLLLIQPDVQLGELNAGGTVAPRADWTEAAQAFIARDTTALLQQRTVQLVPGDTNPALREAQLIKLHGIVGKAILLHLYNAVMKLPSKGNALDWSLGPGTVTMQQHYGADYALFIYIRDSYTTTGRALMMLGAAVFGVGLQGGTQTGFASLVDLRTGKIVWFNQINNGDGDLRTAKPAQDTVNTLLKDIPL